MYNELNTKHKRIELFVKLGAMGIIGFVLAPYIFLSIKGIMGLIIACTIGFVAINMAPWFAVKVANWRLKALKYEASKNPVETLELTYQKKEEGLLAFRDNIKVFHAEVENFRAVVQEHKERYPGDTKYDEKFNKMVQLLNLRAAKYKQAQRNLAEFAEVIERKRSEWKIVQAAAKMDKAAGAGDDFVSKLMADTALDSVQTSLNTAFAELEVSLLDEAINVTPTNESTASAPAIDTAARPALVAPTNRSLELDIDMDAVVVSSPTK